MFSHLIGQAEIKHRNKSYSEGLIQIVRLDKYTALGAFVYLSCQQLIFVLSLINILVSTGPSNRNHLELERTGEDGYCLVCRKKNEEKLVYIRETHSRMTWGEGYIMVMKVTVIMVRMVMVVKMVMMVMQCVQF